MNNSSDKNMIFPLILFLIILITVLLVSRGITSLDSKTEAKISNLKTDVANMKLLLNNHEHRLDLIEQGQTEQE